MKVQLALVAITALTSTASFASTQPVPKDTAAQCEREVKVAIAAIAESFNYDGTSYKFTDEDTKSIEVVSRKTLSSSCLGPAECDDKNPDQWTWKETLQDKDMGITAKMKVSYHRGTCHVSNLSITSK